MQSHADAVRTDSLRDDYILGLLAVRRGLTTQAQLDEAVDIRLRSHPTPRLSDVLVELARIPTAQMLQVFETFCSLLIGSIAIRLELITDEQLFEALEVQAGYASNKSLLGAVLVSLGFLSQGSLQQLLQEQEAA